MLKRLGDFALSDLETVSLILKGDSVLDWHRLNYKSESDAEGFFRSQQFLLDDAADRARLGFVKEQAIDYLRRQFNFPVPRPLEAATPTQLVLQASGKGHRQLCACAILKAMHIIHHVDARELVFSLPMSDHDLFRMIEARVYQLVGNMLSAGLPIAEFGGGRKKRDSVYTKLMSKAGTHASAIYDKLRFRIVTLTRDDLLPVLLYIAKELFAFNYVVPGESINTIVQLRSYCDENKHLAKLAARSQMTVEDDLTLSDNNFSASNYRIIHFVVDVPVRVPDAIWQAAPVETQALGPVVFGLCEFQMSDRQTEESNERGDASHASYKERQRQAVLERLKIGSITNRRSNRGKR